MEKNMMIRSIVTALLFSTVVFSSAHADVLLIESIQANSSVMRPVRGTTMAEVESRFGTPKAKHPAIGEPPITRWDYAKFSVYFEHQMVLSSVVKR